jgi:hypothetical protein
MDTVKEEPMCLTHGLLRDTTRLFSDNFVQRMCANTFCPEVTNS